jgi:hypothetical protein
MFLKKELVQYNNKLYWVYRKFKSSSIKEGKINDVKDLWNCDIVLKTRNDSDELLFLREIPEIELVN